MTRDVPTVRVQDGAGGFITINESDFNADVHTPFVEPKAEEAKTDSDAGDSAK